jgi:hypothetical protein
MYREDAERRAERREIVAQPAEYASKKLLDTVSMNRDQVRRIASEMRHQASAFIDVGNERVADRLLLWANEIEELAELVWQAHGENQMAELRLTEEHTGNMMRLALGLVSLPSRA